MESVDRAWRRQRAAVAAVTRRSLPTCVESPHLSHLQVDDSVCAVALHGVELQVPLEVLSIEAGDGKTIAKTSLQGAAEGGRELER